MDVGLQQAVVGDRTHRLTTTEVRLFSYLVREAQRDVPRSELLSQVWGYADGARTRTVDTTIRRLRAKVEQDPTKPRHLVTVTGIGYRYEPLTDNLPEVPERQGNLRDDVTSFVGRGDELRALQQMWDEGARLVTILGPAGVGKTRLSKHHALDRARGGLQPGGAWFCDLSLCSNEADFWGAVAACVNARIGDAPMVELTHSLRLLGDALLVLDNFEQLADTAAACLATLIDRVDRTRFLVTSRARLRLRAEHCFELAPLPRGDAARLFAARATALRRNVALEPALVDDVVDRLDRLPLAIELAAGRLNLLSLDVLLKRLGDEIDLLAHASRDEQRPTLRAALDRSWELLGADERAALAQCSVFVGDFALGDAEAVVAVNDVFSAVQALRDKSLISIDAVGRLSLLHTIRSYASSKLIDDDAKHRHAQHFLRAHYGREPDWARLRLDASNLEALIPRFCERVPSYAARAAVCLDPLLLARGPHHAQRASLARALRHAVAAGDVDAQVRISIAMAESRAQAGDIDHAVDEASRALAIAGDSNELTLAALTTQANIERRRGSAPEEANARYASALSLAEERALPHWQARVLRHMASLNTERGELQLARNRFEAALAIYRRLGDRRAEATVLGNLGNVFLELVRDAEAATHHRMAIEVLRDLGDKRREAIVLSNLAVVNHQRGALEQADADWRAALSMHRDVANRRFEGFSLGGLAMVDFELGRLAAARRHTYQSLEVARETQDVRAEAIALARFAALTAHAGDIDAAKHAFEEARSTLGRETPWWEAGVAVLFGFVDLAQGDVAGALVRLDSDTVNFASSFQRISQRVLRAAIDRA